MTVCRKIRRTLGKVTAVRGKDCKIYYFRDGVRIKTPRNPDKYLSKAMRAGKVKPKVATKPKSKSTSKKPKVAAKRKPFTTRRRSSSPSPQKSEKPKAAPKRKSFHSRRRSPSPPKKKQKTTNLNDDPFVFPVSEKDAKKKQKSNTQKNYMDPPQGDIDHTRPIPENLRKFKYLYGDVDRSSMSAMEGVRRFWILPGNFMLDVYDDLRKLPTQISVKEYHSGKLDDLIKTKYFSTYPHVSIPGEPGDLRPTNDVAPELHSKKWDLMMNTILVVNRERETGDKSMREPQIRKNGKIISLNAATWNN
jgi:hypothetical protein